MKLDRMIGILSVLLQKENTTAPELAEKFEVSRRTINRDIESLCKAGIPIQTIQGSGGGIRIMEGYRMDRTLLTSKDMQIILAGIRSMDSVSGSNYYGQLMEKLKAGSSDLISARDSILDRSFILAQSVPDPEDRDHTGGDRTKADRVVSVLCAQRREREEDRAIFSYF